MSINLEVVLKSVNFIIDDLNKKLMSTNDFDAVYSKEILTYIDLIRIFYIIGFIPGDVIIKQIMAFKLTMIKRLY